MKQSKVWQGSLDALCGIYSLAHIIGVSRNGNVHSNTERAFVHLLQSMEDAGFLTAKRLGWHGFYDTQLAQVFNNITPRKRASLVALAFRGAEFKRLVDNTSGKALIEAGCKAVVQEHGDDHWIAVTGFNDDGSYCCFDPSLEKRVPFRERISWNQGVLVGPTSLVGAS